MFDITACSLCQMQIFSIQFNYCTKIFQLFLLAPLTKNRFMRFFTQFFFTIPTHLDPLFIYWCIFAHGFNFAEIFPSGPSIYEIYELYELNLFMKRLNVFKYISRDIFNLQKLLLTPQYYWHRWVQLHGVIDTT